VRATLLLLALVTSTVARAGSASVIYPTRGERLRFSHASHAARGVACDFCHERAASSRKATDDLLPSEEACATCHRVDRKTAAGEPCATCHLGLPAPRLGETPPQLRFDHRAHAERAIPCARCHGDVTRADGRPGAALPTMDLCLHCHDGRRGPTHASARCATCHLTRADGTLETALPTGTLVPRRELAVGAAAHGADFRTHHAAQARQDDRACTTCHRRSECLSCHDGVVKPLDFHGGDYVSRHGIDARRNQPDCASCHRGQSFCLGCHQRLGVVDARSGVAPAFPPLGTRRFHPDGWSDARAAANPAHHAWQAQRALRTCASCHREESCMECHAAPTSTTGAAGKMQVSPHPPDWEQSGRCRALASRNARVCLRCHGADDPLVDRCR